MSSWKIEKNGRPTANAAQACGDQLGIRRARFAVLEEQPRDRHRDRDEPRAAGTIIDRRVADPAREQLRTPLGVALRPLAGHRRAAAP